METKMITDKQGDILFKMTAQDNCKHCYGTGQLGRIRGGSIIVCKCVYKKFAEWEHEYKKHKEVENG
jgi:hypothetical protein